MSESESEGEGEDPEPDVEQDDDELPEMEPDEFADVDLDELADEVESESGTTADQDESADQDQDDSVEQDDDALDLDAGESWGDMYVGTLTTVSNLIIEEHGVEDAEPVDEQIARQLHLDEHFDEWMAERGKSEMPPEQAILIGTTMFLIVTVGTKTDLPSQLMQEASI